MVCKTTELAGTDWVSQTANDGIVTNGDTTEDGGVGIDGDVVFQDRVTRNVHRTTFGIVLEVLRTERHTLVQHYVRTDDSGLADDDSRTMIDAEMVAYLCRRVNIDTRSAMREFG